MIDQDLRANFCPAATLQQRVRLTMMDGNTSEGLIKDLFHRDKAEWLRLDTGAEVRLDRVAKFELAG